MTKPLKHHLSRATARHAALVERRRKLAEQRQAEHDGQLRQAAAAALAEATSDQQLAEQMPPGPEGAVT